MISLRESILSHAKIQDNALNRDIIEDILKITDREKTRFDFKVTVKDNTLVISHSARDVGDVALYSSTIVKALSYAKCKKIEFSGSFTTILVDDDIKNLNIYCRFGNYIITPYLNKTYTISNLSFEIDSFGEICIEDIDSVHITSSTIKASVLNLMCFGNYTRFRVNDLNDVFHGNTVDVTMLKIYKLTQGIFDKLSECGLVSQKLPCLEFVNTSIPVSKTKNSDIFNVLGLDSNKFSSSVDSIIISLKEKYYSLTDLVFYNGVFRFKRMYKTRGKTSSFCRPWKVVPCSTLKFDLNF